MPVVEDYKKQLATFASTEEVERDWRKDCETLIANIDWLCEATGEGPENEDAILVNDIRAALVAHKTGM